MASAATTHEVDERVVNSPAMKVQNACKLFGEKGDAVLAHFLQGKEYEKKYDWNREVRRIARTDVPMARAAYDEEEEKLQRERMEFLQQQTRLVKEDAELAKIYQQEEELLAKRSEKLRNNALDQELIKRLHEAEIEYSTRVDGTTWDESVENQPNGDRTNYLNAYAGLYRAKVDDDDGLSEQERQQLQRLQDEELAMALQEYEHLKAVRAKNSFRTRDQSLDIDQNPPQQAVLYSKPDRRRANQETSLKQPEFETDRSESVTRDAQQSDHFASFQVSRQQQQSSPETHPVRTAPRPPNHKASDGEYLDPKEQRQAATSVNGSTDKSFTLVTSVGNSEFYKNIGTDELSSRIDPVSPPKNSKKVSKSSFFMGK